MVNYFMPLLAMLVETYFIILHYTVFEGHGVGWVWRLRGEGGIKQKAVCP